VHYSPVDLLLAIIADTTSAVHRQFNGSSVAFLVAFLLLADIVK
jgi:hypothetical protein